MKLNLTFARFLTSERRERETERTGAKVVQKRSERTETSQWLTFFENFIGRDFFFSSQFFRLACIPFNHLFIFRPLFLGLSSPSASSFSIFFCFRGWDDFVTENFHVSVSLDLILLPVFFPFFPFTVMPQKQGNDQSRRRRFLVRVCVCFADARLVLFYLVLVPDAGKPLSYTTLLLLFSPSRNACGSGRVFTLQLKKESCSFVPGTTWSTRIRNRLPVKSENERTWHGEKRSERRISKWVRWQSEKNTCETKQWARNWVPLYQIALATHETRELDERVGI